MKKILVIASLIPEGGISSWLEKVLGALKEDIQFHLISNTVSLRLQKSGLLDHKNITCQTAPVVSLKKVLGVPQISSALSRVKPAKLLCLDIFPAFSAALARSVSFHKPPMVIVVPGIAENFSRQLSWKSRIVRSLLCLLLKKQDSFIAVSPAVLDHLKSTCLRRFRQQMVPNGIELPAAGIVPLKQDTNFKHIAFLGRLSYEKGPDIFLAIANSLKNQPLKFHVIAEGPMLYSLIEYVKKHELLDQVVFHGHVDNVLPILAGMDALLVTSRTEGLPYSALEAMSCNVPVLSLNVGGMPYLLQEGRNGVLCKDTAEMVTAINRHIVNDSNELAVLAKNARDFVEHELSLEKMAERYRDLLNG
ncbi:MAG: glycosyltransferase family 4 protein [Candidatus Margulisiibacteriota bacterium]|jgi:glycosyltransferase involved in cell wall biosynthesis